MKSRYIIIFFCLLMAAPLSICAEEDSEKIELTARFGLSLGGTMPIGMPASIRSLETYKLKVFPMLAIEGERKVWGDVGIMTGVRLELKGMEIEARVKNYHMSIVRGGEELEGQFTGYNHTNEKQCLITVPVSATYHVGNVRLLAGPYVSFVVGRWFDGYAFDGYLRVNNPTGAKVELGHSSTERGSYDFSDKMRRLQYGINVGADWLFGEQWGVFGNISWGLCGIHQDSFHTIEQTLYPVFGTVGVAYKLK